MSRQRRTQTTKSDLEWALRTIANLHLSEFADIAPEQLVARMADTAMQALAGKLAGVAEACAEMPDNIGHPAWKPSEPEHLPLEAEAEPTTNLRRPVP